MAAVTCSVLYTAPPSAFLAHIKAAIEGFRPADCRPGFRTMSWESDGPRQGPGRTRAARCQSHTARVPCLRSQRRAARTRPRSCLRPAHTRYPRSLFPVCSPWPFCATAKLRPKCTDLQPLRFDRGDRIRTCDRPAPSRVRYQTAPLPVANQAGDGNRTRPRSLEGFCATTTLRPQALPGQSYRRSGARRPARARPAPGPRRPGPGQDPGLPGNAPLRRFPTSPQANTVRACDSGR